MTWCRDLLGLYLSRDNAAAVQNLGFPTTSPMFARLGESDESDEPTGYSDAEVRAMGDAVLLFAIEYPDHWRALSWQLRPWTRRSPRPEQRDAALVDEAMQILAKIVDNLLA